MVEGQEAHRDIPRSDKGVLQLVGIDLLDEVAVMQHHSLALPRGTRGVDDEG